VNTKLLSNEEIRRLFPAHADVTISDDKWSPDFCHIVARDGARYGSNNYVLRAEPLVKRVVLEILHGRLENGLLGDR